MNAPVKSRDALLAEADECVRNGKLYEQKAAGCRHVGQKVAAQKEANKLFARAKDLRQRANSYPYAPGHRGVDTSKVAASKIKSQVNEKQKAVLAHLGQGEKTNSEIFEALAGLTPAQLDRYYALRSLERGLQPRSGELSKIGLIKDTGKRRQNRNGRMEIVWSLAEPHTQTYRD